MPRACKWIGGGWSRNPIHHKLYDCRGGTIGKQIGKERQGAWSKLDSSHRIAEDIVTRCPKQGKHNEKTDQTTLTETPDHPPADEAQSCTIK